MKALIIVALTIGISAHAAVPKRSAWSPSADSVAEMLKLPPENRHLALSRQPDSVYGILIKMSNNSELAMNMRWRALTSAAVYRKEASIPDLLKASKSSEWFMRNASLVALAEFAPKEAIKLGRDLIKDSALVVRSAAVDVLTKYGTDEDREILWKEFSAAYNRRGNASLWIRSQILKSLAAKPKESDRVRWTAALLEKDESVQMAAVKGLEKLTGERLSEGESSHEKIVKMWRAKVNQPSSALR